MIPSRTCGVCVLPPRRLFLIFWPHFLSRLIARLGEWRASDLDSARAQGPSVHQSHRQNCLAAAQNDLHRSRHGRLLMAAATSSIPR